MTPEDFAKRFRVGPDQPGDGAAVNDHGSTPGPDTCPCCEPPTTKRQIGQGRRPPLTPGAPPLAMTVVCAWCLEAGEVEPPAGVISHGLCQRHADAMRAERAARRAQ